MGSVAQPGGSPGVENFQGDFNSLSERAREVVGGLDFIAFPANLPGSQPVTENYALSAGWQDLYTVPAGKKFILTQVFFKNGSAGAHVLRVRVNSDARPVIALSSTAAAAMGSSTPVVVLEAGERLQVEGIVNGYVWLSGYLIDSDSAPIRTVWGVPSASEQTLYTVPAGKVARCLAAEWGLFQAGAVVFCAARYANMTGGALTASLWLLPSGVVATAARYQILSGSVNNNAVSTWRSPQDLPAGYSFVFQSSSAVAGQSVYLTVWEVDA